MNRINFVRFICDLLVIDQPKIYFLKEGKLTTLHGRPSNELFKIKPEAAATTYPEENIIIINSGVVKDTYVYIVLAHELRHIYQYQAAKNPSWGEPMANTWKKEISHYSASNISGYESQNVEIDATAFSKLICNIVLKKDFETNCDQKKLQKRINQLKQDYTLEEIIECYEYNIGTFNREQA